MKDAISPTYSSPFLQSIAPTTRIEAIDP